MFNVAGITARPDRKEALEIAAKLLNFLENNGLEVFLDQKLAQCINKLGVAVLDPEVDDFILIPICPLTILPPLVFSAKSMISVEIIKPKSAQVVIDGYYQIVIEPKQARIKISKSEYESSFIRFKKNFYCRLERRFFPEEGNFEKENSHP